MYKRYFFLAGLAAITLAACKKDDKPSSGTFYGTAVTLGNGSIRSFVTTDQDGRPQSIGLRLTGDALNGLPADTAGMMNMLMTKVPLPGQAGPVGIDHIEVDWNPYGHDPYPIYGIPHFDFHFYLVSEQEQAGVKPGPDTVPVSPQFIPRDYVSGIFAVPDMGVHWSDSTSSEFHRKRFFDTYIYGFYHGKMTFLEPMITREYLLTHPSYTLPLKQPVSYQKSGYYPTVQQVQYDSTQHELVVALSGLVQH